MTPKGTFIFSVLSPLSSVCVWADTAAPVGSPSWPRWTGPASPAR
jgi:hypothetical protein